jgi:hypothetical protein
MPKGEDTRHHPTRKVDRSSLDTTAGSMFGAMDTLKNQLIAQGRYNPEWDKETEEK